MMKIQTKMIDHYFRALVVVAAVLVSLLVMSAASPARASTTFTVNSATDLADVNVGDGFCDADLSTGNLCTLRAAIQESNAISGEDAINFNIPGTGVKTISPQTNLPNIVDAVSINGFSQPGTSTNTLSKGTNAKLMIELNGSGVTGTTAPTGLRIGAPFVSVQGLVINRFSGSAGGAGVSIFAQHVILQQNFIGTDPTGTQDLGNDLGIFDQGTASIGGSFPSDANLISGNDGAGISIRNLASNTSVTNNLIGTDKSGTKRLGNTEAGVEISDSSQNSVENNTIAFNGGDGVSIEGGGGRTGPVVGANSILSNSIFSNGGPGINLVDGSILTPEGESDGPTPNDPGDGDSGPNELQNKPVLTSAKAVAGKTTISGKLNSHPDETYTIQFFSNPEGTDEGETFIDQKTVRTDGFGNATFTFSVTAVTVGRTVTATATREFSLDTSEFSAPTTVKDATRPTVKRVVSAPNATGVAPSANVSAFFSEAMKASTVNGTTVKLKKAGTTTKLAASVTYDPAIKKAVLNPKANLQPGATYIATVTTGAKDVAGNALDQNPTLAGNQSKTWKFTVRK